MKSFAAIFAAAAMMLAVPSFTTPAAAQSDVSVRVGPGGVRIGTDRDRHRHHYRHRHGHEHYGMSRCKTTTIWRDGRRTTIRKCR